MCISRQPLLILFITFEQDLLLPCFKPPYHFHASPLVGAPARPRTMLAFHRGRVSACCQRAGLSCRSCCCWARALGQAGSGAGALCTNPHHLLPAACLLPCLQAGPAGQPAPLFSGHPQGAVHAVQGARVEGEAPRVYCGVSGHGWGGRYTQHGCAGGEGGCALPPRVDPAHVSVSKDPKDPSCSRAPACAHRHRCRSGDDLPGDYSEQLASSEFCLVGGGAWSGWSSGHLAPPCSRLLHTLTTAHHTPSCCCHRCATRPPA